MENISSRNTLRKLKKKSKRCQSAAEKQCDIKCSSIPTMNLVICNAGLVNGLSAEVVYENFANYGPLDKIIMIPGLSCAFVSYKSKESAIKAFENVNGKLQLAQDAKPLYLAFTETEPDCYKQVQDKPPLGLSVLKDFISEEEECRLLSLINMNTSSDLKHRQVTHYGYEFRYDINNVDKDKPLAEKIPSECNFLWDRLHNYHMFESWVPDQLTVNCYQPGQGIPPHVDTHSAFEDPIMSLSLGSTVIMDFKHKDGQHNQVLLPRRSLTIISGESRYDWTHGITPRTMDVINSQDSGLTVLKRDTRTSFTFRKVLMGECHCKYINNCDSYSKRQGINMLENSNATKLEKTYVHKIYENIAYHFSDTRHKPWPRVDSFVQSFEVGSILVDVGCGNGKYLGQNKNIIEFGCDFSQSLLNICADRGFEVFACNCLHIPVLSGIANGVISIAVIHHLATDKRRLAAIKEIVRILCVQGKALIYVWAKDQSKDRHKSSYLKQDRKNRKANAEIVNTINENTTVMEEISLPIHTNRTQFQHSDVLVPWKLKNQNTKTEPLLRFYHVFEENELENLCKEINNIEIIESYYDQGNWCVILKKITT